MAGYYPSNCDNVIPPHNCDPCAEREYGRIRSGAYIHKSYYPTLVADVENSQKWIDGINQGLILVIPDTNGELGEPSELTGAGYGDAVEALLGYDFSATFRDPNYKENCDFWNAIKNSRNYHLVYRTSSSVHITDKPVTIIPKAPIADDLQAEVVWVVLNKWRSNNHPCATNTPEGVFTCFIQQ